MVLDVKRAHFHAPATRQIFVELPPEDALAGRADVVGELLMSMCGTRDAAHNWEAAYSDYLDQLGFLRGTASSCHYYHPDSKLRLLVHGDDFVAVGYEDEVRAWESKMQAKYPCVTQMIGQEDEHEKELKVLGRWIRLTPDGVEIEIDAKYIQEAIDAYDLGDAKSVATPATREEEEDKEDRQQLLRRRILAEECPVADIGKDQQAAVRGEPIDEYAQRRLRSVAALLNYIMPDRPDLLYGTKELLRAVSAPGAHDETRVKRILRYLLGSRRRCISIPWDNDLESITVYVDSDFAGCRTTRRSTCGGCIAWAGALVKSWSKTMSTLALSTGEAELGATVKGAAEAEGVQSVLRDFAIEASIVLKSDASAAIGITKRLGLGKVRHLATGDLWIQQRVHQKRLEIEKLPGEVNPSDAMTKGLDRVRLDKLMELIGVRSPLPATTPSFARIHNSSS